MANANPLFLNSVDEHVVGWSALNGDEIMTEFKICNCKRECGCFECENHMEHPIKFENNMYEVTEMKGYKCTKNQVYSTLPELKKGGYIDDVITGKDADSHIKRVFEYAELTIRQLQKGEIEIKYKY